MSPDWAILLFTLAVAALPGSAVMGLRWWRRARLIDDTPTSRVRSAAQGYVELCGRAGFTGAALRAPLSGRPCTWWSFRIERKRRGARGRGGWETIQRGTSEQPFLLIDGTDCCLVDPRGADVYPLEKAVWYGSVPWPANLGSLGWGLDQLLCEYRYVEHRIHEHEVIGALGEFRTVGGAADADPEQHALQLLRAWKADQQGLLQRFDANHDGVLGAAEWERARAAARRQVLIQAATMPPEPRLNILVRPADGSPYLLAAIDLARLARRYRWGAALAAAVFVASAALAVSLWSM